MSAKRGVEDGIEANRVLFHGKQIQNYTKAAQELHVSQPTISVAIQKLEDELGIKLMERDNKGIRITGAGKYFLQKVKKVLDEIRDLEEIMEDLRPSGKKHLKAAFPSTVGSLKVEGCFSGSFQRNILTLNWNCLIWELWI